MAHVHVPHTGCVAMTTLLHTRGSAIAAYNTAIDIMLVSQMNHSGLEGRCEFSRNSANEWGGAIFIQRSSVRHTAGRLTFHGNFAGPSPEYNVSNVFPGLGGAIAITTESTWHSSSTVLFSSNYAYSGGAVYSSNSQVSFETITTFFNNQVVAGHWLQGGGALFSSHSMLTFSGSTLFHSNTG